MKVYRLEKCGVGPYRFSDPIDDEFNDLRYRLCKDHGWRNETRLCWSDIPEFRIACDRKEYRSGCSSLESLKQWFHGWWDVLVSAGFEVNTYETDNYILADRQLVFIPQQPGE